MIKSVETTITIPLNEIKAVLCKELNIPNTDKVTMTGILTEKGDERFGTYSEWVGVKVTVRS